MPRALLACALLVTGASALLSRALGASASALVGIAYWQPEHSTRPQWMKGTLTALRSWKDIDMRILVASNKYSPELEEFNVEQVLRPGREQGCNETHNETYCLTWNVIRSLRDASTGGTVGPDNFGMTALDRRSLKYDYYIYTESDIEIPADTFMFWRAHTDHLYKQGYLLHPIRLEHNLVVGKVKTTDCYLEDCVEQSHILQDTSPTAEYLEERDRHYLQLWNPYPGCWFMTRNQYKDYLDGPMWNYTTARAHSPWGLRETVSSGLIWDPRFNNKTFNTHPGTRRADIYGLTKSLSHLKMAVWHQVPMTTVGKGAVDKRITADQFHEIGEFEDKVDHCTKAVGDPSCGVLS